MAKKKFQVSVSLNVGYTTTVEADSPDEAIDLAVEEAESTISGIEGDNIDYADADKTCIQVEETED